MKFILVLVVAVSSVRGWGALFNRFSPSLVPEDQRSGSYYNLYTESKHNVEEPKVLASTLDKFNPGQKLLSDNDPCYEKKCTANENCCDGTVCIDMEQSVGTCMPLYGRKVGELCYRTSDCETGYVCGEGAEGQMMCMEHVAGDGAFGEECVESKDCNIAQGLCCRLQRRQRTQPTKLCTYFTSSDVCIGPVAHHKVRRTLEYTANEKRRSAHPDHQQFYNF